MKRPRFSLPLMLLIVALAASMIAWQAVGWRLLHQGRRLEVQLLESAIRQSCAEDQANGNIGWYRNRFASPESQLP